MASDGAAEEVKSRLDIVEHISDYVQLKRSGQNFKGNCPFHNEKTPSFMVHPAKQIFHCFGCSAGGDIFTFTMKHEGLSFPEALALLARKAGVELKPQSGYKKGERENMKAAVSEALKFFRSELVRSGVAGDYMAQRGLTSESIEEFQIGYVPQGWHNLLNHLKKKRFTEDIIIKAGLAVRGDRGPYDVFRARLIFPILDLHGEPVAFGGRVLDDSQPKYLNSPESSLFKKGDTLYALSQAREAIRKEGFVAVAEGYLDAIMCHQFGLNNVVAPLGTALTAGHLKKLMRHADNIVLVFDGDAAGVAAARRSLDLIMEQNMRVSVLMLPDGQDPDSLLRDEGAEGMRARMMDALSPVGFILDTTAHPKGINDAVEMIAKAGDPILRDELAMELSDRSRVSEQAIRDKLSRYKKTGQHSAPRAQARAYNEETLLLSVALAEPALAGEVVRQLEQVDISDQMISALIWRVAGRAEEMDGHQGEMEPLSLAEDDTERSMLSRLMVSPGFEPDDTQKVLGDCIRKILRRKMDREISDAEHSGDMKLLARLLDERKNSLQASR